ncbi:MAG: hypothetical protein RSA49_00225 [Anaerovoracaceae bacterium]
MIDKSAIEILKLYDQRSKLSIKDISLITDTSIEFNSDIVIWLYENNLIETNTLLYDLEKGISLSVPFHITQDGKNRLYKIHKHSIHFKVNEFRAWITLLIALAAFFKSFFF